MLWAELEQIVLLVLQAGGGFGSMSPFLIQVTLILLAARFVFNVPMEGNLLVVFAVMLLFIAANLTLGITFSTLARNQLQAMQLTFFFFLPSMLLTGHAETVLQRLEIPYRVIELAAGETHEIVFLLPEKAPAGTPRKSPAPPPAR